MGRSEVHDVGTVTEPLGYYWPLTILRRLSCFQTAVDRGEPKPWRVKPRIRKGTAVLLQSECSLVPARRKESPELLKTLTANPGPR